MEEGLVEVPPYFLCPISLETMRDPVTLHTGITFDRENIERWIFSDKHKTCPVTKQPLMDLNLTPNHTLRRLIQAWCSDNASNGVERFPTPRPPIDQSEIATILEEAKLLPMQVAALQKLKAIVSASDRNKRCVEASGAVAILVSTIEKSVYDQGEGLRDGMDAINAGEEALCILCSLQLSEEGLIQLVQSSSDIFKLLTKIMSQQNYRSRAYAVQLVKSLLTVIAPVRLSGLEEDFYEEILKLIRDRISWHAMKAALQVLGGVCSWNRNRIKAVQAGAVPVMVELLLEESDRRVCEMILVVLDHLCGCADGRADLVGHAAGIAVVSKKLLRVSPLASGFALRILYMVAKLSSSPSVLQEMLQVGAVAKLFYLLHLDTGMNVKGKAKEILRLHSKVWRNSPCLSPHLQASYPSSREE